MTDSPNLSHRTDRSGREVEPLAIGRIQAKARLAIAQFILLRPAVIIPSRIASQPCRRNASSSNTASQKVVYSSTPSATSLTTHTNAVAPAAGIPWTPTNSMPGVRRVGTPSATQGAAEAFCGADACRGVHGRLLLLRDAYSSLLQSCLLACISACQSSGGFPRPSIFSNTTYGSDLLPKTAGSVHR